MRITESYHHSREVEERGWVEMVHGDVGPGGWNEARGLE